MKTNSLKNFWFFVMLFTTLFLAGNYTMYSQEEEYKDIYSPRKTYLYKSMDQMKSNEGEYVGIITELTTNRLSHPIINSRINSKHFKNNVQKYWGFKIGEKEKVFLYRWFFFD